MRSEKSKPPPLRLRSGQALSHKTRQGWGTLAFLRSTVSAGLDYQDHAWAEDGYVAVVALEGGDGGSVGVGYGVESLAVLHFVVNDCGGCYAVDLSRFSGGWLGGGCFRGLWML